MSEKVLVINDCVVEYVKLDESIEIICSRCGKRKISKKYGQYSDAGTMKRLCNGCYGNLLSRQKDKE